MKEIESFEEQSSVSYRNLKMKMVKIVKLFIIETFSFEL